MADNLRVVTIIQARMASSRLPGKVLMEIAGKPMLVWVVERASRARYVSEVVVATTTEPDDDPIEAECVRHGISVFRGDHYDVLDRFYQAAGHFSADVIVRLTADCPLIDPDVIDQTVERFIQEEVDFAANRLPPPWKRTFPIGLDTEVCTYAALERAWKEAKEPFEREHVMPYFYDVDGRFRILVVDHEPDYGSLRWTVDTPEDLKLVRNVFEYFPGREDFNWYEIIELFEQKPELALINAVVKAKQTQDVDDKKR